MQMLALRVLAGAYRTLPVSFATPLLGIDTSIGFSEPVAGAADAAWGEEGGSARETQAAGDEHRASQVAHLMVLLRCCSESGCKGGGLALQGLQQEVVGKGGSVVLQQGQLAFK